MQVEIVDTINISEAYQSLYSEDAGAINVFVGTVRNNAHAKTVKKLVFEAYDTMAIAEMNKIATAAKSKWPLEQIIIQHVTGEKKPGDPVVFIGVSSPHRDAAFEACRFIINEIKKTVPIWKKEFYEDNSTWVNAHP